MKQYPYAHVVIANPDAIQVNRVRWHLAKCVCAGILELCPASAGGERRATHEVDSRGLVA